MRTALLRQRMELRQQAAALRADLRQAADRNRRAPGLRRKQPHRDAVASLVARQIGGQAGAEVATSYRTRGRAGCKRRRVDAIGDARTTLGQAEPVACPARMEPSAEDVEIVGFPPSSTVHVAEVLCREHRLRQWVREVNQASGLTPDTCQVWQRWLGGAGNASAEAGAIVPGAPLCRRAVQWVRRWRRRWGVRRGRARPVTRLGTAELRQKAHCSEAPRVRKKRFLGAAVGKKSGRFLDANLRLSVMDFLGRPRFWNEIPASFFSDRALPDTVFVRRMRPSSGTVFSPPRSQKDTGWYASTWTRLL